MATAVISSELVPQSPPGAATEAATATIGHSPALHPHGHHTHGTHGHHAHRHHALSGHGHLTPPLHHARHSHGAHSHAHRHLHHPHHGHAHGHPHAHALTHAHHTPQTSPSLDSASIITTVTPPPDGVNAFALHSPAIGGQSLDDSDGPHQSLIHNPLALTPPSTSFSANADNDNDTVTALLSLSPSLTAISAKKEINDLELTSSSYQSTLSAPSMSLLRGRRGSANSVGEGGESNSGTFLSSMGGANKVKDESGVEISIEQRNPSPAASPRETVAEPVSHPPIISVNGGDNYGSMGGNVAVSPRTEQVFSALLLAKASFNNARQHAANSGHHSDNDSGDDIDRGNFLDNPDEYHTTPLMRRSQRGRPRLDSADTHGSESLLEMSLIATSGRKRRGTKVKQEPLDTDEEPTTTRVTRASSKKGRKGKSKKSKNTNNDDDDDNNDETPINNKKGKKRGKSTRSSSRRKTKSRRSRTNSIEEYNDGGDGDEAANDNNEYDNGDHLEDDNGDEYAGGDEEANQAYSSVYHHPDVSFTLDYPPGSHAADADEPPFRAKTEPVDLDNADADEVPSGKRTTKRKKRQASTGKNKRRRSKHDDDMGDDTQSYSSRTSEDSDSERRMDEGGDDRAPSQPKKRKSRASTTAPSTPPSSLLTNPLNFSASALSNYSCIDCAKTFNDASSLRKHAKIHGERMFECPDCQKRFIDNSKLKRHMLVHTGERKFACTYPGCHKKFALDFNLKSHMRVHTGEKPFACPYPNCGRRFAQVSNLKAHKKTHDTHLMQVSEGETAVVKFDASDIAATQLPMSQSLLATTANSTSQPPSATILQSQQAPIIAQVSPPAVNLLSGHAHPHAHTHSVTYAPTAYYTPVNYTTGTGPTHPHYAAHPQAFSYAPSHSFVQYHPHSAPVPAHPYHPVEGSSQPVPIISSFQPQPTHAPPPIQTHQLPPPLPVQTPSPPAAHHVNVNVNGTVGAQ